MSSTAFAPSLQFAVPDATAVVVLTVLLTGGLVGMSIRNMVESIMSDEEAEDGADGGGEGGLGGGGDGLMAEEGGDDDLGGLGGLDDDDDFGGFGDGGDEFGEMDSGGGNVDELEHRLDELENEVGSLSSTVNTVRNENEQISESVQDVEENVRKLLDIYEMVTRGVNPFADDIDAGMAGGMGDDGSFGLFADENGGGDETIDDDIAEADAEGFFDDELVEEEETLEADADVGDVLGGGEEAGDADDAFQESFDENFEEEMGMEETESDDDGGSGMSFEDLKDEYESGDADWADGEEADADLEIDDEFDEMGDGDEVDDMGEDDDIEEMADDAFGEDLEDDDLFDEVIEEDGTGAAAVTAEPVAETAAEPEPEPAPASDPEAARDSKTEATESTAAATDTRETGQAAGSAEGKPYLVHLPGGFASELIVVEWLEFLVDEAGVRETAQALDYYETIDWVSADVAEDLREYLRGFDGRGSGSLTIDHHTQSLEYISQLNGGDAAVTHRLRGGGGSGGL